MPYYRNNTEIEIHLEQRRAFVRSFVRPTNEIQFFFFETSFWVKKEEERKKREIKKKKKKGKEYLQTRCTIVFLIPFRSFVLVFSHHALQTPSIIVSHLARHLLALFIIQRFQSLFLERVARLLLSASSDLITRANAYFTTLYCT